MIEKLKSFKWQQIFLSVVMLLAGGLLITAEGDIASIAIQMTWIGLIAFGCLMIIRYFFLDIRKTLYRNDFIVGLIVILCGALVMVNKDYFMTLVPMILGFVIVISGVSKVQDAIDSFRMGYPKFSFYILLSLASLIIGLYVVFNPKDLAILSKIIPLYKLIGGGLIYSGVVDFISSLYLSKLFNEYLEDLEAEEREEEEKAEIKEAVEEYANTESKPELVLSEPVSDKSEKITLELPKVEEPEENRE